MNEPRYDRIGLGYAATRREDPRLRDRINRALGDSRSVINVGAGTGSYEPSDRYVLAVEPSDVMAEQRPDNLAPALRGSAAPLPLRDRSVDAAMAILTVHHWDDELEAGIRELRRVASGPVIIVSYDADVCSQMWLYRDYMPEAAAMDRATFPPLDRLAEWLGGSVHIDAVPTHRDTPDWTLASFWAHPDRVLDPNARATTSAFARMDATVVERIVTDLTRDLRDGTWEERNQALRALDEFDVGMRLVIAHP